ncbi:MAG: EamA family transporter [Leptolyngbyaceae cyanobacterium RU_5_1]|nr:EamA family transporter [Leptolyngbyaceae cyanobacterium RU_5_1]
MGQMENQPESRTDNGRTVEGVLQTVTQDLKRLHQGLITQLSQEVTELQAEKAQLTADVKKLQTLHQKLQAQQTAGLSQQQLAQQQLWAKQLALALANHLQGVMVQQIDQIARANQVAVHSSNAGLSTSNQAYSENAHRLLASLDATFSATFRTLQQELNSYQSSLSQQLSRMHNMEQQGEAVLEALVGRLREQLQAETARRSPVVPPLIRENGNSPQPVGYPATPTDTIAQPHPYPPQPQPYPPQSYPPQSYPPQAHPPRSTPPQAAPIPLEFPAAPLPPPPSPKKDTSNFWLGLLLILLSTIALSTHNVVVQVIGRPSSILGLPEIGGFINITILGNSLLILWLRMMIVLPLMVCGAMFLYRPVWRDLKTFLSSSDRRPIYNVIGSGIFLFLSQVLIYIAIGQIGPGPAVTILFMYPVVTVPLTWLLFGDRPTKLRWAVMGTILLGVILTALPKIAATNKGLSLEGVGIAIASGIAFALYLIFMQLSFNKKLHPVPVSLVQFFTIFVLSAVILILVGPNLGVQLEPDKRTGFILGGILLGALTLVGYLANNFGVRFMGAALASIIASIGPVMTAFLAWILIQSSLSSSQWVGIFLVTLGVGMLSFERMKLQTKPRPARKS